MNKLITSLAAPASGEPPRIGRRLIGLLYDFFPLLGLWFVTVVAFLALHYFRLSSSAGEAYAMAHASIEPNSLESLLLFLALLGITGLYFTASWRRGGQTIGMKPFRTYVLAPDGSFASWRSLWIRFFVGLLALPVGFALAYVRADKLTLHDWLSNTRFVYRQ